MTLQKRTLPLVLVGGYWLGAWAWDEVIVRLTNLGVTAHAVTLPGLESLSTPRSSITFADHVEAVLAAIDATGGPAIVVAHSGAGAVISAVLDRAADRVARAVYVECGPVANGSVPSPNIPIDVIDVPLPPFDELERGGASLSGLTSEQLARFRARAVPQPAGAIREAIVLGNPARNSVPATIVCCSFPSNDIQALASSGNAMFSPLLALTKVTYVDLPTGHWPMWSAPDALASILAMVTG